MRGFVSSDLVKIRIAYFDPRHKSDKLMRLSHPFKLR